LYSACAVTLVAFGHYNRPCYLLTYSESTKVCKDTTFASRSPKSIHTFTTFFEYSCGHTNTHR